MLTEFSYPSMIAEATRMTGDTTFFSSAIVFGVIEGNVIQNSSEALQIGKSGWVHGEVTSQGEVIIAGRVDGHVRSLSKIKLLNTAVVHGVLEAPLIQVQPGAIFEGRLKMALDNATRHKQVA